VNGHDLVVVRTAAGLRAFQGHCPHRGALLGEGELDGEALVCRNHRWRFDAADGKRLDGPGCLVGYPVREVDGEIVVELPRAAAAERSTGVRRRIDTLPGPAGLPFFGNAFQLDIPRLHEILEGWAAEYGPVFRYRLGTNTTIAVADPELVDEALRQRPERFRRLHAVETVFEEMKVAGVFSAEGAAWRPQRRLSMEALSHRHLRDFYPTLARVAGKLRARLARAADAGEPVDIVDTLKRFTVDVTTILTLGHDVNTLEQGDDVIQRKLEQIFPAFNRRLFALFPTWRLVRLPADRRLDEALAGLHAWMRTLVAEAQARLEAEPSRAQSPANFLEAMVAARDEDGRPFAEDVILGNLVTMLVAGEDTTAYTLAWAVHHLCDEPEAVAGLVREAASVMGGDVVPDSFETANRLVYAAAVANETMRLRPVAPIIILEANEDTVLGDIELPARTGVAVLLRPAAVDAENFADPSAFRPERWLPGAPGPHEPSVHMPFGSGPRLCPGRALALLEMKIVLATLYGAFAIERRGTSDAVKERFTFTMNPVGLEVGVRHRQRAGERSEPE
jgi:cytochrome P450/nitrite reductase/ring-hydroxylating ferredoxin subunit